MIAPMNAAISPQLPADNDSIDALTFPPLTDKNKYKGTEALHKAARKKGDDTPLCNTFSVSEYPTPQAIAVPRAKKNQAIARLMKPFLRFQQYAGKRLQAYLFQYLISVRNHH